MLDLMLDPRELCLTFLAKPDGTRCVLGHLAWYAGIPYDRLEGLSWLRQLSVADHNMFFEHVPSARGLGDEAIEILDANLTRASDHFTQAMMWWRRYPDDLDDDLKCKDSAHIFFKDLKDTLASIDVNLVLVSFLSPIRTQLAIEV